MNPIVEKVILIISVSSILSLFLPLFRYDANQKKADDEWDARIDQKIKDFLTNPKHYKNWKEKNF